MSSAINLVAKNVPGYGPSDRRCLPCSGVSGRAVTVSPCFSHGVDRQFKIGFLKYVSRGTSLVCKASSGPPGGHRRNPDFSRQNKHGYSRGRNRQNEDRDTFENLEESELLSSKNGPSLSFSSAPKFQATAAPGPREREIVELFRKVQVQLRERAAIKEEKKFEAQQGHGKESENVNSLLKLLRKHSHEQGKRRSNGSSSKDFSLDQPEQNGAFGEHKNTNFPGSNSNARAGVEEPNSSSLTRPPSNFQRKSPVPRVKYQPIFSGEGTINSELHSSSNGKRKKDRVQTHAEPEAELEPVAGPEAEPELEPDPAPELNIPDGYVFNELSRGESSATDDANNDTDGENELNEHRDLSALKLLELRALAKSQGMKGFSKMKKSELVELLNRSSV